MEQTDRHWVLSILIIFSNLKFHGYWRLHYIFMHVISFQPELFMCKSKLWRVKGKIVSLDQKIPNRFYKLTYDLSKISYFSRGFYEKIFYFSYFLTYCISCGYVTIPQKPQNIFNTFSEVGRSGTSLENLHRVCSDVSERLCNCCNAFGAKKGCKMFILQKSLKCICKNFSWYI